MNVLSVPAPEARGVELCLYGSSGRRAQLTGPREGGWWDINLRSLNLADGIYEYEFLVEWEGNRRHIADPYAEELTGGPDIRAVMRIRSGERVRPAFSWDDELPASGLPSNHELVIYELPMRGAGTDGRRCPCDEGLSQLDQMVASTGVNCIQMLPIQDSPDTLHGGYGTRFLFAPDRTIGTPLALRGFIKRCHQRGIRVIMDLVMNHAHQCPLRELAFGWFFLEHGSEEPDPNGDPRPRWGGDIFRYRTPRNGAFHARNLQYDVANFFIAEYHVDGFRLDEFKGIDNYEFVQEFTMRSQAAHYRLFNGERPFIVIAEDSSRRTQVTTGAGYRGRPVVDAIWDFDFRDDIRGIVSNAPLRNQGVSRQQCVQRTVTSMCFPEMVNRIIYCTSHDAPAGEELRLVAYYLDRLRHKNCREMLALEMAHGTLALTLTSAGIPMFLAGEESARLLDLIRLRTTHPALHRKEVEFFGFNSATGEAGFHPSFDEQYGARLFAFSRTGGQPLGSSGQVIVAANCSEFDYPSVTLDWPWGARAELAEIGGNGAAWFVEGCRAFLELRPYQVRVFSV